MKTPRKNRFVFYGVMLSAIHFTAASLLSKVVPLLLLRPEDMVGSGDTKPYWPPSRLRDSIQGFGDVLCLPASWLNDCCPNVPVVVAALVVVLNSFLWGFALALVGHLVFTRLIVSHAPRPA